MGHGFVLVGERPELAWAAYGVAVIPTPAGRDGCPKCGRWEEPNFEEPQTNLVSGMVLVGLSPGQVRLQLTVFTEDESLTGQLVSFVGEQNDRRVKPVSRLSKELLINVIPRLSLAFPPRMNPQILMSPHGRLRIRLPASIATESSVGVKYSIDCPSSIVMHNTSSSVTKLASVSASGLLEAGAAEACNGWSTWRAAECFCLLHVSYSSSPSSEQHQQSESATQSLKIEVVVKPPRYVLARAQRTAGMLKSAGLPFGGPYPIALSFHDEQGEAFDAVAGQLNRRTFESLYEFMGFHVEAHRSNLVDYYMEQRSDAQEGSWPPCLGLLMVRMVSPLHAADSDVLQAATTLNLRPGNTASAAAMSSDSVAAPDRHVYFFSSYVTLPTGPQLTVDGVSEFVAGQWTCLPSMPQGPGLWSSSDPSVLWIDNESGFMLPLRAGRVHLLFSPTMAAVGASSQRPHRQGSDAEKHRPQEQTGDSHDQLAFLGQVIVLDFYDLQPAALKPLRGFLAVVKDASSSQQSSVTERTDRDSLLAGGSLGLEFGGSDLELQFILGASSALSRKSAGVRHLGNGRCASAVSHDRLDELTRVTPFVCSVRLHAGNEPAPRLPAWLRAYLLAERYVQMGGSTSEPSLLPPLSLLSVMPTLSDTHFTARLTPNTGGRDEDTGTWVCSVRYSATSVAGSTGSFSSALDPYAMLASLMPGARLIVQVFDATQPSSESAALATTEVPLTPPFRLLVPPVHLSSQVHLLLTPRSNAAHLLVFVPPATLATMEATQTLLKARSLRPDVLAIHSAPRPVASVEEDIRQAFVRLADSPLSAAHTELMVNISRLVENEAEVSTEQTLGGGLVWTIGLPMDLMVEVVISLRTTGQHVSVPVRVLTRSISDVASGSTSEGDDANAEGGILSGGFWTELPWLQFILLIFITWALLLAAHLVTKAMNVNGTADTLTSPSATKNLPPLPTAAGTSTLWTQGFGQPGNRYSSEALGSLSRIPRAFGSPAPNGYRNSTFSPTTGVRAYGDSANEQRTAVFRGSSPSRLREAFDNSL
ncbi:unnamed protein product [Schistocephalus solidus]|uniref:C2 domain-containing protein n=1 Tax=Schistocephalus solidus TaxID=70667 RepID=A0A183SSQ7_SCHSO|nr:unnamed protein product [Schistocephalus solidus]